jgi:hypothetical protein
MLKETNKEHDNCGGKSYLFGSGIAAGRLY